MSKNNRLLTIGTKRYARPKGKKVFPISIALTPEQIAWLEQKPNASEIIRKILNDLIAAGKDVESKLEVVSLSKQIEELEAKRWHLVSERFDYIDKNRNRWETEHSDVDWIGAGIKWEKPQPNVYKDNPVPLNNEKGQIGARVLKGYNDSIDALEQKIQEVKKKILEST